MYKFPDYRNSLVNISNSIAKHYGVQINHHSHQQLDKILENNFKHIFLVLIDGLGVNIINKHLNSNDFLYQNKIADISSVYPPTTVAATTALLSGLYPIETGWIGWTNYIKELDRVVILFTNVDYYTGDKLIDNVGGKYFPYHSIFERIAQKGAKSEAIMPSFHLRGYQTLADQIYRMKEITKLNERTFSYVYVSKLDSKMHELGIDNPKIIKELKHIDKLFGDFAKEINDDTLIIALADHGHINVQKIMFHKYSDLMNMLERKPSLEPRTTSFKVKPEYLQEFPVLFNQYFNKDYRIYTREEFLNEKFLGDGKPHQLIEEILGDYIAVAITDKYFELKEDSLYLGHHAGLTEEELTIPLIVYYKK